MTELHRRWQDALQRLRRGPGLAYAVAAILGLLLSIPIWCVQRPPIQDLPQHVAAVRVLADFGDPALKFHQYFELVPWRTQYLTVYILAALLAQVTSALVATKCVLTLAMAAIVVSSLRLRRALGLDPWLGLMALVLVWNVHVFLGFINFIAAISLLLLGLALGTEERRAPSRRRRWILATLLVLTFLTHVVAYALLVAGLFVLGLEPKVKATLRACVPLIPSLVAAAGWSWLSPAGNDLVGILAAGAGKNDAQANFMSFGQAYRSMADFLLDILPGQGDDFRFVVFALLLAALLLFGPFGSSSRVAHSNDAAAQRGRLAVATTVLVALVAYFFLPEAYGFIWPISQRFPLLALLLLVALIDCWRPIERVAAVVAVSLSVFSVVEVANAFRKFEPEAYSGFDAIEQRIPLGSRVAGLIFRSDSPYVRFSPLLHAVAWVQADRGGLVMFTFAEFPSSPFTFRPQSAPPRVPPRWEWAPGLVFPDQDLGYYDYVLVRGGPGAIALARDFVKLDARGSWSLWRRVVH